MVAIAESGLYPEGFKVISGTSVGAINGGGVAQYAPAEFSEGAEYARRMWLERITSWRSIYRHRFPPYLAGAWKPSLYRDDPLRALLDDVIDEGRVKTSGVELRVTGTNLEVGCVSVWSQRHPRLIDCIRASASFPVAFPLVEVDGALHTDGYLDVAPLSHALEPGIDQLVVVLTQDPWSPPTKTRAELGTVPAVGMRAVGLLVAEAMRNDIDTCQAVNNAVAVGTAPVGCCYVNVTIIAPSRPLGPSLDFDADGIRANIDLGYEDTRRILETERG